MYIHIYLLFTPWTFHLIRRFLIQRKMFVSFNKQRIEQLQLNGHQEQQQQQQQQRDSVLFL